MHKKKLEILNSIKRDINKYEIENVYIAKERLQHKLKFQKKFEKKATPPKKVQQIIDNYNKMPSNKPRILVVCHGKKHHEQFENTLTMNMDVSVEPDIVSNIYSIKYMKYFPKDFFDKVLMMFCPISDPFALSNDKIWKNIYRILKPNGQLLCNNIIDLYSLYHYDRLSKNLKNIEKKQVREKVKNILSKKYNYRNITHEEVEFGYNIIINVTIAQK